MAKRFPIPWIFILLLPVFLISTPSEAQSYPEIMFILDASGSMWGKVQGRTKIDAAKEVMRQTIPELPTEVLMGLTVYGHSRESSCDDIEILVPAGSNDRQALLGRVENIQPHGKTPMAASVKKAAESLGNRDAETIIVLVSDGEETCDPDPCGTIGALNKSGARFILHVIGFDVNEAQKRQLTCFAEAGGGRYFSAADAGGLLDAFQLVGREVAEKVEKAKTTTKRATSKLGKLHITMPPETTVSLHVLKLVRKSDGKLIKTIEDPGKDSTHPLLSGEYELIAGFANSNYKPDSEVSFGDWTVEGGETAEVSLGGMALNVADSLKDAPVGAVMVLKADDPEFSLVLPYTGNDYYFYKTKPLPAGSYQFAVHYKRSYLYRKTPEDPVVLAEDVRVEEGKVATVTVDSGIVLVKPQDSQVAAWELLATGNGKVVLKVVQASNGDYPLWKPYAVPPGVYDLNCYVEGMEEPLPAAQGLEIKHGELLRLETGL